MRRKLEENSKKENRNVLEAFLDFLTFSDDTDVDNCENENIEERKESNFRHGHRHPHHHHKEEKRCCNNVNSKLGNNFSTGINKATYELDSDKKLKQVMETRTSLLIHFFGQDKEYMDLIKLENAEFLNIVKLVKENDLVSAFNKFCSIIEVTQYLNSNKNRKLEDFKIYTNKKEKVTVLVTNDKKVYKTKCDEQDVYNRFAGAAICFGKAVIDAKSNNEFKKHLESKTVEINDKNYQKRKM